MFTFYSKPLGALQNPGSNSKILGATSKPWEQLQNPGSTPKPWEQLQNPGSTPKPSEQPPLPFRIPLVKSKSPSVKFRFVNSDFSNSFSRTKIPLESGGLHSPDFDALINFIRN